MAKKLVSFRLSVSQNEKLLKLYPSHSFSDSIRQFLRAHADRAEASTPRRGRAGDKAERVTVRLDAADADVAARMDVGKAIEAVWDDDL